MSDGMTENQPECLFSKHSHVWLMNGVVPFIEEESMVLALDQLERRTSAR